MEDFLKEIKEISQKLDAIEIELFMNQEAAESIEMDLRFLKAQLDYETEGQ
jgi:hypothetical protein